MQPTQRSLLIRGGRVVDPGRELDDDLDVLIGEDGLIAEVAAGIEASEAELLDATGKVVTPGLIDIHVHLRDPGQEYKEDIRSGARAAAAGGFTAVACMANTVPVNDSGSVTEHIVGEARRHGFARVYPVGAVSKGLRGEELAEVGDMVAAGAVGISDDGRPVAHPELMRRALLFARHFDLPVVQHAQDMELSGDGVMHEGAVSARFGVAGIPAAAEDVMVARDLLLAEDTGGRYHVQHLSSARALDLIRAAKQRGVAVTCEVTPHHLLLTEEAVEEQGLSPDTKMNPPLRSERDRRALVEGIADGSIDCIASDHAPHHPDEKELDFVDAPFGIIGLETTLSLCLDRLVRSGLISLSRLIALLSSEPARVMGLPGGSLAPGSPGDVTLLDLEREVVVDARRFESKSRNTPFQGWRLIGAPAGTVVGGRVIRL
ncbi:MAG TPA: dihydroorotase [Thermoanaerobaculia bacterium]|nr:dihydroorotase [Thermoanaerobaculia bacterium]